MSDASTLTPPRYYTCSRARSARSRLHPDASGSIMVNADGPRAATGRDEKNAGQAPRGVAGRAGRNAAPCSCEDPAGRDGRGGPDSSALREDRRRAA